MSIIDININTGSGKNMEKRMDVIVNLPDPNKVVLPSVPFVVATTTQEALLVGSRIDNDIPVFCLTHLLTGVTTYVSDPEFRLMYANKLYVLADCNITVNI